MELFAVPNRFFHFFYSNAKPVLYWEHLWMHELRHEDNSKWQCYLFCVWPSSFRSYSLSSLHLRIGALFSIQRIDALTPGTSILILTHNFLSAAAFHVPNKCRKMTKANPKSIWYLPLFPPISQWQTYKMRERSDWDTHHMHQQFFSSPKSKKWKNGKNEMHVCT